MKKIVSLSVATLFLCISVFGQGDPKAKEIVNQADKKNRGNTSQGEMTMQIVRPGWERTISMKYWSQGTENYMICITAPAKEKGQVFMKRENEMWNWVPSISRMIKIPPSMMMQSWMGSDFTNDDLLKESSIVVDYYHTIIGEEKIDGYDCYKIMLDPKPEAPVVWGKIILWISKEEYLQMKSEFYDEDDYLIKTMAASNIKMMDDRLLPSRLEIIPEDNPDQKTILITESVKFNQPIEDNFFTQQNMKRIR